MCILMFVCPVGIRCCTYSVLYILRCADRIVVALCVIARYWYVGIEEHTDYVAR